ncbi:hypothetical protein F2Q69_00028223 [Brassica cretica]|uniref:Serpin domain-containing protein n=1 Tax=Brassica cretica TaxID=69181 RepID=A0A8S9RZX1_BRACR|nr:hypothetical protein F2Q69_00028223 [Brassica cretica]
MFQQLHESEDYYDHFSYSVGESEPVYDIFHEVQAELLHKVHAELQKMNVSITEDFRSLKATMNHMMEIVKKIKLSGRRSDGGNAPLCAQENLAHKTAPPKRLRAQSSPMGHKPRTSRFKQPVEHKRFNSSKYGSGSCALPSRVKDVLFGTYGKQPFDRGRNGDDEVRLKICINRFDQVVYSLLLAKHSLLHKIFHVYVSEVCVVEDEPLPALTLAASGPDGSSVSNEILSFLRSSSTHELNAVFSKLVSVIFADHSVNGGPKITSVNGVWIEQTLPIDSSFKDLFENVFKAAFDGVDFLTNAEKVRIELNKWAEDHTNGLIKDLLPPGSVSSQTGCVFGNALYFKGAWEVPFDKSYTKDKEFQLLSGTSVSVPFMSSYKNQYIKAYDGFKVLRIPYRQGNDVDTNRSFPYRQVVDANGSFSMYFYLPDKNDGLDDLMKAMATTSGFVDCHVPISKVLVNKFRIPKFKIAYGLDGQDLGLRSMALYHKACVEIDEEGAKAAAATFVVSCGCARYMEPPKRIDFVADHPFLFLIREDKTGTVLFVGQIKDPSNKSA